MNREEKNKISKDKILQAALCEFGQKDYNSASINNICINNDITKGLLFHYYKNKDEIFLLCVDDLFINLSKYLNEESKFENVNQSKEVASTKGDNNSIDESFERFVRKRFDFFDNYPYYRQIFFTCIFTPPKHLIYDIQNLRKPVVELNKKFWLQYLSSKKTKENVDLDECVEIIIGLEEYIQTKLQREHVSVEDENAYIADKYIKDFMKLVNMLLYGILI